MLYACVRGVMDVICLYCDVWSCSCSCMKYECFVMQMLYVCVLCAIMCILCQFSMLHSA